MSHLNRSREHKQVHQMNSLGFFHSHLRAFSGLFALLANLIIWTCTLFVLFCFVFLFYSLPVCALFFFLQSPAHDCSFLIYLFGTPHSLWYTEAPSFHVELYEYPDFYFTERCLE